ncbi:alkaline-phosphatase-like protein, partial [Blyttiomyces helicus]
RLRNEGSWTDSARAALPTVSAPNWYSILSGTGVDFHGVDSNNWRKETPRVVGIDGPCVPQPTIFTLLRAAHPSATLGAFFEWPMLSTLIEPTASLNTTFIGSDDESVAAAASFIARSRPELTFVYIGEVDLTGHRHGAGDEMQAAIAAADAQVGILLDAVEEALEKSLVLVVSDHGREDGGWDHRHFTMREVETQAIAW